MDGLCEKVTEDGAVEAVGIVPLDKVAENGGVRNGKGQFKKGHAKIPGAGRAPGTPNKVNVSIQTMRQEILDTWAEGGGKSRLLKMCHDDFPLYMHTIAKFMPRDAQVNLTIPFLLPNPALHNPKALDFMAQVQARADGGPVTPALVLETLDAHSRGELKALPVSLAGPVQDALIETGDTGADETKADTPSGALPCQVEGSGFDGAT